LARPEELAELSRHGLKTVVDLRSAREDRQAVLEWAAADGVAYWNYPIVVGDEGSRDNDMYRAAENGTHIEYLRYAYGQLATAFGAELAGAFERIAEG